MISSSETCKFSPDGTQLVTLGFSGASLWKIAEDNITYLHNFHDGYAAESSSFSYDGLHLILAGP